MDEIEVLSSVYKRHGGKKNRRNQVAKIRKVFEYAKIEHQIKSVHQLGSKQIVSFYKANEKLSEKTMYAYWLALKELYNWLNRSGEPPKPKEIQEAKS